MSTSGYLLNAALLVVMVATQCGRYRMTWRRFVYPVLIVAGVGYGFLHNLPTAGNDVQLDLIAAAVGTGCGLLAWPLVTVAHDRGRVMAQAGVAWALVWVAVVGGRMLFAWQATRGSAHDVARFSMEHDITGSDAWTAAFVVMALAIVLARTRVMALRTQRVLVAQPA